MDIVFVFLRRKCVENIYVNIFSMCSFKIIFGKMFEIEILIGVVDIFKVMLIFILGCIFICEFVYGVNWVGNRC